MEVYLSWTDFKARVVDKKWVRFTETDGYYTVTYPDDLGGITCSVLKDSGSDQTDFETNYKPSANASDIVPKKSIQVLGTDVFRLFGCATSFTATKTTDTTHDFLIPTNVIAIKGANAFYINAAIGDYVKVTMVDVDNVLGYGAGTVLGTFINKWFIPTDGILFIDNVSISLIPVAGLYLRFKYTSVGTVNDVDVFCNFISYEAV